MSGSLNWKGIIFWAVIACILAFAVMYFLPLDNWTIGEKVIGNPAKNLVSFISSKLNFNTDTNNLTTLLSNNWTTVTGIGLTMIPLGYTTIKSYIEKQKAVKELAATTELAKIANSNNALEIDALKKKLSIYETDTTADLLQQKINGITSEKELLAKQLFSASDQTDKIQTMHTQFLEKLAAAANNQTVYDPLTKQHVKVLKITNNVVTVA